MVDKKLKPIYLNHLSRLKNLDLNLSSVAEPLDHMYVYDFLFNNSSQVSYTTSYLISSLTVIRKHSNE